MGDNRGKNHDEWEPIRKKLSGQETHFPVPHNDDVSAPAAGGICEYCGMSGAHPECRKKQERYLAKRRNLLRQFANNGKFGSVSPDPEMTLEEAVSRLKEHLGHPPEFDTSEVVENRKWWFIPHNWIGILGFVVDKRTGQITALGSGWGAVWEALEAFQAGLVDPEPIQEDEK